MWYVIIIIIVIIINIIVRIISITITTGKRTIPALLKSSIVTPFPKVTPPREIESDLRPISLTCNASKGHEGICFATGYYPRLTAKSTCGSMRVRDIRRLTVLLYMLQAIYEATDCGYAGARIFYANFSKGFDLIESQYPNDGTSTTRCR